MNGLAAERDHADPPLALKRQLVVDDHREPARREKAFHRVASRAVDHLGTLASPQASVEPQIRDIANVVDADCGPDHGRPTVTPTPSEPSQTAVGKPNGALRRVAAEAEPQE